MSDETRRLDFIREIIEEHNRTGRFGGRVQTRFPPEPNGYLHIGHARAIYIDFGIAEDYGGVCNLRMDDTNPSKEEAEYVDAIAEDIRWLGYHWGERILYASDYFDALYDYAEQLIRLGKAYVDDLSPEEVREYRGTLTEPGRNSPYRERSVEENLALFRRMRAGEFDDGARTLRAKIDMASPNIVMRDPIIYRIMKVPHHRTGNKWCIYPMYDFAHCLSDSLEGVTHSLCSLEFENNRELYDWYLDQLGVHHPQQIEFAKLEFNYTVLSKRRLRRLVEEGYVTGWDDPRMPTLAGMRRRGYTPEAIRNLVRDVGISKANSQVDIAMLEHAIRDDLNARAPRAMAVLDPLKVVITNYPEEQVEWLEAINNPQDPTAGTRQVPFSRELYIERDDFREQPPKKFFRLSPGAEVRLRYAYLVTCTDIVKDPATGEVVEVHCTYDPATRGGDAPDGRKVKGTLHWVSAPHAVEAEARLYDRLFNVEDPYQGEDFIQNLNPHSLEVRRCLVEPSLADVPVGYRCQFERLGYFCVDPDSTRERRVFNRTITLRDSWAKLQEG
ncbi:MAG: glutamine--tRNA ligase/YqeY domain fusion protein [Anaerolineales bacterium]